MIFLKFIKFCEKLTNRVFFIITIDKFHIMCYYNIYHTFGGFYVW